MRDKPEVVFYQDVSGVDIAVCEARKHFAFFGGGKGFGERIVIRYI